MRIRETQSHAEPVSPLEGLATVVKVTVHERCGNAPKKQFVRDFLVAVAKGDSAAVSGTTTDDLAWNIVGARTVSGKAAVLAELHGERSKGVRELIINTIVTHGYDGVAEGLLTFANRKSVAFCDIYEFRASTNNAPIKAIKTYRI
jgi:limonene-1,2-epoxide hydrolase